MRIRFQGLELGTTSGRVGDVGVSNVDFTYPELRTSDSPREARDGVMAGRDYFGARTVSIECWTNGAMMREARGAAAAVLGAWRDEGRRLDAGVLAPLDFQAVGDPQWRRMYGRPRRADDPLFGVVMSQGRAEFILEFEVMDPVFYAGGDDGLVSSTIRVVEGGSGTGWVFPIRWPVRTEAVAERRSGALQITGELPTPAIIEFRGPGSRFSLDGSRGWHVGLRPDFELAWDETVTVDPLAGTILSSVRGSVYGALDRRSQLTGVKLHPGVENVFFSANDPSNTASATVSWRPAFSSAA